MKTTEMKILTKELILMKKSITLVNTKKVKDSKY